MEGPDEEEIENGEDLPVEVFEASPAKYQGPLPVRKSV